MGFFSKLKKISLGGQVAKKLTGSQKDYGGFLEGMMATPKPPETTPFDPGSRTGATINGQSGVDQPSMRLGWTNGGYQYHNSPFNMQSPAMRPHDAPTPQPMPQQPAPPMAFGGGGNTGMGMSGPGAMLQGPSPSGSMPPAGAQAPQGPPTAPNPEMIRAIMLRNGGMVR